MRLYLEQEGVGVELSRTKYEVGEWAEAVAEAWAEGKDAKARKRAVGETGQRKAEGREMAQFLVDWVEEWQTGAAAMPSGGVATMRPSRPTIPRTGSCSSRHQITSVTSPNVQIMAMPVPLVGSAKPWATTGTGTSNSEAETAQAQEGRESSRCFTHSWERPQHERKAWNEWRAAVRVGRHP